MKTNELMIGDWVRNTEFEKNGIDRIEDVEPRRVWLKHGVTYVPLCYIEPIPITPEILEKNGFEEDDGAYIYYNAHYDDCVNWCGTILKIGCDNGNMELADIQYVHEMQHALRLCGIKKEIEL